MPHLSVIIFDIQSTSIFRILLARAIAHGDLGDVGTMFTHSDLDEFFDVVDYDFTIARGAGMGTAFDNVDNLVKHVVIDDALKLRGQAGQTSGRRLAIRVA